jgi:hypothetical protein
MNNLRYAFRQLRQAPAFTLTALATVAICLGANLAIFAVIDSILLRPLPFPQSDRLVTIFNTYPKAGVENDGSSLTNYYERRGAHDGAAGHCSVRHSSPASACCRSIQTHAGRVRQVNTKTLPLRLALAPPAVADLILVRRS